MKIETLTSPKNPLLKAIRRAVRGGEATPDGFAVAEGFHLLDEAIRSGCELGAVIVTGEAEPGLAGRNLRSVTVHAVPAPVFQQISTTEASQGVLTLVRVPAWDFNSLAPPGSLIVALDGIQEPGNAGAIARVAEAFGATGMVCLQGTVNVLNPKSLRASAGSLFRLPFLQGVSDESFRAFLRERPLALFAAVPARGAAPDQARLGRECAILIGSEGRGVRPVWAGRAEPVSIPTRAVESLNAAVAAGIILYEAQRQRGRI